VRPGGLSEKLRAQALTQAGPNFLHLRKLAALGWADGPNLRMEIRWGGGNVNRASVFAKELVALQPDVILAQGTPVTKAAKFVTSSMCLSVNGRTSWR
jgi:hypothetical protein